MFGLQRTAELHRHQLRHVVHEGFVTGDLGRIVKALGKDEVQIALQGVAEDDRFVITMALEQLDQAVDALGQLLNGKGHVLDDHRGAGLTHRTHGGEGVLADLPQLVVDQRVFAELHAFFQREIGNRGHDQRQLFVQQ